MKALVLKEYNRFALEDAPEPPLRPDSVMVAVKACGICGSDVHGMDGSTGRRQPPIIMGHEAAGVIVRTGPAVQGWKAGARVTFDSTIYCGACEFCRQGRINVLKIWKRTGERSVPINPIRGSSGYAPAPSRPLVRHRRGRSR